MGLILLLVPGDVFHVLIVHDVKMQDLQLRSIVLMRISTRSSIRPMRQLCLRTIIAGARPGVLAFLSYGIVRDGCCTYSIIIYTFSMLFVRA